MNSSNETLEPSYWLNETEVWTYIENLRGAQQQDLSTAIPLTVINSIIFISGITGNVGVCIVINKNSMLHTATHYFLFNLAVADILLLVFGLPHDVAIYWHQYPWVLGEFFCKLRSLISEMASYVSVMTIVVFSTERYLAICHPLHILTVTGLSRAVKIIGTLWLIGFIASSPFYILTELNYLVYPENSTNGIQLKESAICALMDPPENFPLFQLSFVLFFMLPLVIILMQYIMMSSSIAASEKPLNEVGGSVNEHRLRRRAQSNKSIIRMLLAVVVGFFCCWAPFHAQRLVFIYAKHWEYIDDFNMWMFFITGIFYYFSSTLNPILYNVMSKKMRSAFRHTFRMLCTQSKITRNSEFSSSNFHGRQSRSFREESQLICSRKASVKKDINYDNNLRCSKRYDLLKPNKPGESNV